MDVLGVIPARLQSQRLPQKPLLEIRGKPLIQWVYERARDAKALDRLLVATDAPEIREAVHRFGGEAILTSRQHASGTDRVAEVAEDLPCTIVVDIQGDEPLIRADSIDELVSVMLKDPSLPVATLAAPCGQDELDDPNVVKIACGNGDFAVYFSRAKVPYFRNGSASHYKHVGVYAFRRAFLLELSRLPVSKLERTEGLEQLRVLENGHKIKLIFTRHRSIGVDTPEDIRKVAEALGEDS